MTAMWQRVRSGAWLTAGRLRGYSLVLLAICILAATVWVARSHGLIDPNGKPIGTDFSSFYTAGTMVLEGHAAAAYDMAAHHARERQLFGADVPFYSWLYPPMFLMVATPLALMPYLVALPVWQAATLILYLAAIGTILRGSAAAVGRRWLLPALAFPAVFINLGHGQNGLLTAALFGAALAVLPARPLLAGVLFGLLAYKPQFGLMIPLALLAVGQWRAVLGAGITIIALAGISTLLFGTGVWHGFAASTEISRVLLLEQGDVGFEKMQSVFSAARMWGASVETAYALQFALAAGVAGGILRLWRSDAAFDLKAAALAIASLLVTPYVLDYDMMVIAVSIAFFVRHGLARGFLDYEISMLAAVWLAPLVARSIAGAIGLPVGVIMMLALFGLIMRRATLDRGAADTVSHGFIQA